MNVQESDVEHKIELFDRMLHQKIEKFENGTIPQGNIPGVYQTGGNKLKYIGLYKISMEDCQGGIESLTDAVGWYRDSIEEFRARRDSPSDNFEGETTLLDYLYCALLSGDETLQADAAELVRDTEPEHYDRFDTQWRYHYTQALAASILEAGDQQTFLDDLERTIPDHDDDHETFFTALWIALSGLEAREEAQFHDGCERFLDWHDSQVDFENKTSAEDLVCKQIAALVVLARQNGMTAHIDSEYIPDCLQER